MTSERKKQANRRNSQLSTGPKDTRKTRYNAVKHGITSEQVIVPEVDGHYAAERYEERREGLREELAPQGTLEAALVDQIALSLQIQRRLTAYEMSVVKRQAERASEVWSERNRVYLARVRPLEMRVALNALDRPGDLREVTSLTYLVGFLRERLGASAELPLGDPIEINIESDRETIRYSPGQNQILIEFACEQRKCSEDSLRTQLKEYLGEQLSKVDKELERGRQEIEHRLRLASLPGEVELNRILKYDSRISNGIYKSLHELHRLQASRQSRHLEPPVAVDVFVNVDSTNPVGSEPEALDFPEEAAAAEESAIGDGGRGPGDDLDGRHGEDADGHASGSGKDRRSTVDGSPSDAGASHSSTWDKEDGAGGHEPDSKQGSGDIPLRLQTHERKGLTLKEYLGDAEATRLFGQPAEPRVTGEDAGGCRNAGEPRGDSICENEANALGKGPTSSDDSLLTPEAPKPRHHQKRGK